MRAQAAYFKTDIQFDHCVGFDSSKSEYLAPVDGGVVFGGFRRFSKTQERNERNDSELSPEISEKFNTFLPQFFGGTFEKVLEWSGIMGFTFDGKPFVGQIAERIFVIAGFNGHGMPVAPIAAKLLAAEILSGKKDSHIPPEWRADRPSTRAKL